MRPRAHRESGLGLIAVAAIMALLLIAGLVVVAFLGKTKHATSVVLVVLDTVRADHVSAYGYGRPTTPRLEKLAHEGLLFEHARAAAPWTLPSHASLFTGKLPAQHGCTWEHRWLVDRHETMAEKLAAAGFETFGVTTNPNASSLYNLQQGFATFLETWRLRGEQRGLDDSAIANARIRAWLTQRDANRPFFLFVNFADAHLPYAPPPPCDSLFGTPSPEAKRLAARADLLHATLAGEVTIGPEESAGLQMLYDGELRAADARVGELLDLLDELDVAQDTLVIVTSDHGEQLGEAGRVDHQLSLSEELLHVPLIVRWPRQVRPARIPETVALVALKDWIDDVAIERVPEWSPPPDREPDGFVAEYDRPVDLVDFVRAHGGDWRAIDRRLACVFAPTKEGGRKLVVAEPGGESCFDVDAAGREAPSSSTSSSAPGLRSILSREIERDAFVESDEDLVVAPARDMRDLDDLRRLGYVGGSTSGDVSVHAAEHEAAARRARASGDFQQALLDLTRAIRLAPNATEWRDELARWEQDERDRGK